MKTKTPQSTKASSPVGDKEVKARLKAIAKELAQCKPNSTKWKRLMKEVDVLCGIDETERNPELDEAWEQRKKRD